MNFPLSCGPVGSAEREILPIEPGKFYWTSLAWE